MTLFARPRDGVEAPPPLAGFDVVGVEEAPDAVLAAGHARDYHVLDDQRRAGHAVAGFGIGHLDVPDHRAGFGVESDQMRVYRADEDAVSQHRHAAIHGVAADIDLRGKNALVMPVGPSGRGVEREDVRGRLAHVHHAIDDNRRRFHPVAGGHLVHPGDLQIGGILPVDLVERAVAPALIGAGVGQPVIRLALGFQQPLVGYLGVERARQRQQQEILFHSDPPFRRFSEARYATISFSSESLSLPL